MVELWATMPKVLALILNVVKRKTWCSHLCTHSSMPLDVGNGEETYAGPRRPSLGVPDPGGSQWDTVRQRPRVPREITFPCLSLENRSSSAASSFVYSFILGQFLALLMLSGRPGQATSAFPTWISYRLGTIQHFCMYVCAHSWVCVLLCVLSQPPQVLDFRTSPAHLTFSHRFRGLRSSCVCSKCLTSWAIWPAFVLRVQIN